ncbi:MAG: bifunctional phosphoglucose/phosphomannose isomerase [candidate division Zixibacteria bacterium]|nr:bifunctional phosphoglucose/phosphomannose isomerase [candidate division Zixibacteria bacterium]
MDITRETADRLDPSGMYKKIHDFPEQLLQAAEIGRQINLGFINGNTLRHIIVAGMGGSAIGGDLIRSFLADRLPIPLAVCRHYTLPNYVNEQTLVIVSSYSGNTEETVSACRDALSRKASIICLTSGGKIGAIADEIHLPVVPLPPGYPPRAALGFSFVPLMFIMEKLGFAQKVEDDIHEIASGLKAYREQYKLETPTEQNPAKQLAQRIHNRIPILYSGPDRIDTVATRWKGQICENAKCLAFHNQFPEFNHNELVGWEAIDAYRDKLVAVYLMDSDDHDRVRLRMNIVRQVFANQHIEVAEVISQGDFPLGRIFSLIQLGDFMSYYLALLNGVDPYPVKVIDFLKDKLK